MLSSLYEEITKQGNYVRTEIERLGGNGQTVKMNAHK